MSDNENQAPEPRRMRPVIGHDNRPWWDKINEGELPIQKCTECGTLRHPPRPMCWKCQSLEWEMVPSSGKGTVYSYSVVRQSYHPFFRNLVPYAVAYIDLAEGPRFLTNVVGVDDPLTEVHIGQSVELVWEEHEELSIPLVQPV